MLMASHSVRLRRQRSRLEPIMQTAEPARAARISRRLRSQVSTFIMSYVVLFTGLGGFAQSAIVVTGFGSSGHRFQRLLHICGSCIFRTGEEGVGRSE